MPHYRLLPFKPSLQKQNETEIASDADALSDEKAELSIDEKGAKQTRLQKAHQ